LIILLKWLNAYTLSATASDILRQLAVHLNFFLEHWFTIKVRPRCSRIAVDILPSLIIMPTGPQYDGVEDEEPLDGMKQSDPSANRKS